MTKGAFKNNLENGDMVEIVSGLRLIVVGNLLMDTEGYIVNLDSYNQALQHKTIRWLDVTKILTFENYEKQRHGVVLFHEIKWTWEGLNVLSESEEEWLRDMVKPIRWQVENVVKEVDRIGKTCKIIFNLKNLRQFKINYWEGTEDKYIGLEENKPYTLEELGI